jgi:hypothetical protein
MKRKPHRFKIASTKPEKFDFHVALKTVAHNFMAAERELTPLIIKEHMSIGEALVLIAVRGDAANSGNLKDHSMTQEEIISATTVLVELWKKGSFIPSLQFPYTLQQALEEMGG